MKSVALDTCVVLRLLLGEPITQAQQAYDYLEECYLAGVTAYVSDLVVAETYHGLCHHYQVPTTEATENLTDFLSSPMITPSGHSLTVLCEYDGTGAGFVDRLIRAEALDSAQEIVTFDKKFARLPNVQKIPSP
jgi:predicted nucleic-acid-binding protein